jgi:hypothetical protein
VVAENTLRRGFTPPVEAQRRHLACSVVHPPIVAQASCLHFLA